MCQKSQGHTLKFTHTTDLPSDATSGHLQTLAQQHDKTNKLTCAPSEDSDQPGHPPSLVRVFAVRSIGSQGPKVSSCGQRRFWSDWADAQADLSLRWMHRSCTLQVLSCSGSFVTCTCSWLFHLSLQCFGTNGSPLVIRCCNCYTRTIP